VKSQLTSNQQQHPGCSSLFTSGKVMGHFTDTTTLADHISGGFTFLILRKINVVSEWKYIRRG